MRGSQKMLETVENNKKQLKNLMIRMFIANLLIFYIYMRNGYTIFTFFKRSLVELILFFAVTKMSRPILTEDKPGVFKIISVVSLENDGLSASLMDSIAFIVVAKILCLFSTIATIITFMMIPVSFVVEIFVKPYRKMTRGGFSNEKIIKGVVTEHNKNE